MKVKTAGIIGIIAGMFILMLGFGGTPTSAIVNEDQEKPEGCFEVEKFTEYQYLRVVTTPAVEEVSHQEYLYEKEVRTEQFKTEFRYEKYTQTRTATSSNYGYSWSAWSDWSNWSPWGTYKNGGGYSNGWGAPAGEVLEGPAPHGSGYYDNSGKNREKWERQYRYQKVDERQVSTGFVTETVSSGWVKEMLDEPWVLVDEKTVIDQEFIPGFDTTYYYTGEDDGSTNIEDAIWTEDEAIEGWTQFNERESEREVEVTCPTIPPTIPPTVPPTVPPTTEPPVTTVPPTTAPPTTEATTTTTEPPVITTTVPPTTPPTVATTTPPTVPPTGLPETGSNATIWTTILGLLALAGGSGLIYASRRS